MQTVRVTFTDLVTQEVVTTTSVTNYDGPFTEAILIPMVELLTGGHAFTIDSWEVIV